MKIVGFNLITDLIAREKRQHPAQGKTPDRGLEGRGGSRQMDQAHGGQSGVRLGTADIVGDNRLVFDICGNSHRLVVQFNYAVQVARVRCAGTHFEYDKIDVTMV